MYVDNSYNIPYLMETILQSSKVDMSSMIMQIQRAELTLEVRYVGGSQELKYKTYIVDGSMSSGVRDN